MSVIPTAVFTAACLTAGPQVELFAHRGASRDAPENTVAAFQLAWKQHADGAECDLRITKDGRIVACHDETTKRTAGIELNIAQTDFAQLRTLDVGSFKGAAFKNERLPLLEELLATIPKGKKIYLEVKCGPEIVPELIRQLEQNQKPAAETPVICFNTAVIAELKRQRPKFPAYLLHNPEKISAKDLVAQAKSIQADGVDLKACPELDDAYAQIIREAGLRLDVWTVNDPAEARRLIKLGVQGITTDRPGFLRESVFGSGDQ